MRRGNLLFSAVQFIFAFLVVLVGLFFVGLQEIPFLRYRLSQFFSNPTISFAGIGYLILVFGFLLFVGFCVMYRGHYYQLTMGRHRAGVDPELIEQLVTGYWKNVSSDQDSTVQVRVSSNQSLNITFELSSIPLKDQEPLFEKVERELSELLYSQLGYNKKFIVSVLMK
jgi:hypothetical protein